jgi:PAS domain S-box-containing protein
MQNKNKVKILFVEDLPTDFELAKREIQKGNIDFISRRVDEKESFLAALEEFHPDIIVSDYSMPTFDGLQVIKLAEVKNPLLPVVILTGSLNEYTAVECIKSGAVDYVIKESITRLPFAVEDALRLRRMKEEQLIAEKELQESKERYRQLYDSMIDAYAVKDMDGKFTQWNKSFEKMLGYNEKEIPNLNSSDITPVRWHSMEEKIKNEQILFQGYSEVYEKEYLHKDGTIFPVELRTFLIRDAHNKPNGMWSIVRNITERKRFEDQLKTFQMATEQSPASIIITDTGGLIEYVNPMFCKISGISFDEIIGRPLSLLNLGLNSEWGFEQLLQLVKTGSDWKNEYQNKRKDGAVYWESTLISPIKDNDGKLAHVLLVQEDISERKEFEMKLMNAKEKAEEMNRLKSNFLANMSHELRTPLVGMLGFSELLYDEVEGQNREFISMINRSGQRLLRTLNTLLSYSKIESEKLVVHLSNVSVLNLLREEIKLFEILAQQNGLFLYEKFTGPEFLIITDERLLKEVIDNLINNAIKFTNKGGVVISLQKFENEIIIIIEDTGIGIPEDKLQTIFEDFRQVSEGKGRNFEGTGLGLTIVKKYVDALGGSVIVKSTLGVGSTFLIHLPLVDQVSEFSTNEIDMNELLSVSSDKKVENGSYKILLVEDDLINSLAIASMISEYYQVTAVNNADSAISEATSNEFDVILMDINLKTGKNGIEAAQAIRNIQKNKNTPIVAMTAYAMTEDREEFLKSGCSSYISKPFTRELLINLLDGILSKENK